MVSALFYCSYVRVGLGGTPVDCFHVFTTKGTRGPVRTPLRLCYPLEGSNPSNTRPSLRVSPALSTRTRASVIGEPCAGASSSTRPRSPGLAGQAALVLSFSQPSEFSPGVTGGLLDAGPSARHVARCWVRWFLQAASGGHGPADRFVRMQTDLCASRRRWPSANEVLAVDDEMGCLGAHSTSPCLSSPSLSSRWPC